VIIKFEKLFEVFKKSLDNASNLHIEFWRELIENSPDIKKIENLGS
jgi:hypothetical protein